jgi:hypothetical protein
VNENGRRSIQRFLQPLPGMAAAQADLLRSFEAGGEKYFIPRFTFQQGSVNDFDTLAN